MTRMEFYDLCGELLIDPNLALADERVMEAIRNQDEDSIYTILHTEF